MIDYYDYRDAINDYYDLEEYEIEEQEEIADLTDTVKELRFFISDLIKYKAFNRKYLTVKQIRKLSKMIEQLQAGTSELNQYDTFLFDATNADINPLLIKIVKALAVILDTLGEIEEDPNDARLELMDAGENLVAVLSQFNSLSKKPWREKINRMARFY